MPAVLWTGTVSFGLVAIPVRLLAATRIGRLAFHQLHDADYGRLRRQLRCPADGAVLNPDAVTRGAEVAPGHYVSISEEELAGLTPTRSRTIEIERFVDLEAIPRLFYDRPYYLAPQGAEKPYRLLAEALLAQQKIGLARLVLHTREHLVGLRALGERLCLYVLRFAEELHPVEEVRPELPEPARAEVQAMTRTIHACAGSYQPKAYADPYLARVRAYLDERRQAGETVAVRGEAAVEPQDFLELMDALDASMARARERSSHAA